MKKGNVLWRKIKEKRICGSYACEHVFSLSLVLNVCDATTGSYLGVMFKGTGIAKPYARIKAVMHCVGT